MDSPRDMAQMEHENSILSPAEELEDLFNQIFDWQGISGETKTSDHTSHHHHHRQPSLTKIITDIPLFIKDLTIESSRDFFDMPYPSDDDIIFNSSGQTPPDLVQGGSTSPSDHSGSPLESVENNSRYHPEASLREVQAQDDEWTYPQTDPSKAVMKGYPPHLQGLDDRTKKTADPSLGLKRRRPGDDPEKRPRQLADPDQTADVRRSGACLPCRMSKTRCQDSGVCPTCRKAFPDHSHLACTRASPSMFWPVMGKIPDVWSSNPKEEEQLCSGPRFYTLKPREISVFFTRDINLPSLRATVQAYRSHGGPEETGSLTKADFPRDCVPSHQLLQNWIENQIRSEYKPDFQHAVQSFLLTYSEEGVGLPKHGLASKVHKMNCFFRIWKAKAFWCIDPTNKLVTLPLSVQAQLRNIARRAIYSLEHDILKEMDDCLAQQGLLKPQERMAIWASMWQLIFMYRELLQGFKTYIDRLDGDKDKTETDQSIAAQKRIYKWLADAFFPLLTVFYHYQFRTKKSLELSLDWLKSPSYPAVAFQSTAIRGFAQQLLDSRKEYYQELQSSNTELDQLLCIFVVNHELKKMNARKRPSKASSKSKNSAEDDCEEDAE